MYTHLLKSELKDYFSPNKALLFLAFIRAFLLSPFSGQKRLVRSTQLEILCAVTELEMLRMECALSSCFAGCRSSCQMTSEKQAESLAQLNVNWFKILWTAVSQEIWSQSQG